MDMSKYPIGEIVASHMDTSPIDQALKGRAEALASQLNSKAGAQLVSDMGNLEFKVTGEGQSVSGKIDISDSYIIEYLKNHSTPVAGGDSGTVHDPSGATYHSNVDPNLWGTELPWYEMPIMDVRQEAEHVVELMFPDAVQDAVSRSTSDIGELIKPEIVKEISSMLGA